MNKLCTECERYRFPGVTSLRRAGVLGYNPTVDEAGLIKSLKSVATSFVGR